MFVLYIDPFSSFIAVLAELFLFKGLDKDKPRIEFNIETVDYII